MVKRAKKTRDVKRKKRPRRPRALTAAQIDRELRRLFPALDDATIRDNRAALLLYLEQDGDNDNKKIYEKPGEFGRYANAHVAYVRTHKKDDDSDWRELTLKKFNECDTIVLEAQYRKVDAKCPPDNGFAALVRLAEKQLTDRIALYECPDKCGGSYFYTSYRKWFCQEDDVVVIVQATRMCYVT